MMFPDRTPSDLYLYTTFIGGSRNQELARASRLPFQLYIHSCSNCFCLYCCLACCKYVLFLMVFYSFVNVYKEFSYLLLYRDELKKIVAADLRQLLGAEGEPTFVKYV